VSNGSEVIDVRLSQGKLTTRLTDASRIDGQMQSPRSRFGKRFSRYIDIKPVA